MKVCFWATTFQADIQTLAYYLAEHPAFEVVVAMDNPDTYLREPICELRPFKGILLERQSRKTRRFLKTFHADLLVVDNHLPAYRIAERILVIWHGYGWRKDDISGMRKELEKHVGDVTRPNPAFIWQAFGENDRDYTVTHRKIASENVVVFGSAYSDVLSPGSPATSGFDPQKIAAGYTVDVLNNPTVLVGMTWHYGGLLGQFGNEIELIDRMLHHLRQKDASVIFRMHDRRRYNKTYIKKMKAMMRIHPHVQLTFKDESPDSLIDILVSDVMVTNFSSFANAFYYTRKPCVHIHPMPAKGDNLVIRQYKRGRVKEKISTKPQDLWKLPLTETGGLTATSFPQLLEHLDHALDVPLCCEAAAELFIEKHIAQCNGQTCKRLCQFIQSW